MYVSGATIALSVNNDEVEEVRQRKKDKKRRIGQIHGHSN
jgi:hypothetical protein